MNNIVGIGTIIMYWKVKGYNGFYLTKKKLDSNKYSFSEIEKEQSDIINYVESNLQNDGYVFCLSKDNVIKAIYILKITLNDEEKILTVDRKIVLDEVDNKVIKRFENELVSILLNNNKIDGFIWPYPIYCI